MTCGAVLLIVGASTLFGKILTFEEAPQRLASIVLGISDDPHLVLLMIIGVLYVLGMFMETLATIIILVPVLLPMILQLGIDPIHFGIVLVVTNNVAMLTPPLGVNLFVASRIAGISVERISVAVIPYLIALTCVSCCSPTSRRSAHAAQPYGVRAVAPAEALLYGSARLLRRADSFPL